MSNIRCRFVYFSAERISGWAYDDAIGDEHVVMHMFVDGEFAREVECNIRRKDLNEREVVHDRVGFRTSLPLPKFDGLEHDVAFYDPRDNSLLLQRLISAQRFVLLESDTKNFGHLRVDSNFAIHGWLQTDQLTSPRCDILIDGILIGSVRAENAASLEYAPNAKAFSYTIPSKFFDDSEHVVACRVVSGEFMGEMRADPVLLPKSNGRRFAGHYGALESGRLTGQIEVNVDSLGTPDQVALLVDGVEEVRAPVHADSFTFNLTMLPVSDWIDAEIQVIALPEGALLTHTGTHLVSDAISIELESIDPVNVKGILRSELPDDCELSLMLAQTPDEVPRSVTLTAVQPGSGDRKFEARLDSGASSENLRFSVNGKRILHDLPNSGTRVTPSAGASLTGRPRLALSDYVAAKDSSVATALQAVALGTNVIDNASSPLTYSGAWRFAKPDNVQGWALNIQTPAEPLIASLLIDGVVVERRLASEQTIVVEAGVLFPAPVGFSFSIPPVSGDRHAIDVRIEDVATVAPHKARTISFVSLSGKSFDSPEGLERARREVDKAVADGRYLDALLYADRIASDTSSFDPRAAALDFYLRTEWRDYANVVEGWRTSQSRQPVAGAQVLINYLEAASQSRLGIKQEPIEVPDAQDVGLPASYSSILKISGVDDSPRPAQTVIDQHARWKFVNVAREEKIKLRRAPGRLALAYFFGAEPVSPSFLEYVLRLAAKGHPVTLGFAAEAPAALAGACVAKGIKCISNTAASSSEFVSAVLPSGGPLVHAVVSKSPIVFGADTLAFLPSIIDKCGRPILSVARVIGPDLSVFGVTMLSRQPVGIARVFAADDIDSLSSWLKDSKSIKAHAPSENAIELAGYILEARSEIKRRALVLHNLDSSHELPRIPPGVEVHRFDRTSVLGEQGEVRAASDLALSLGDPLLPVVVISSSMSYPPNYIAECLRLVVQYGTEIPISLMSLIYDRNEQVFTSGGGNPSLSMISLTAGTCFRAKDLFDWNESDSLADSIFLSKQDALLVIPFLETIEPNKSLYARSKFGPSALADKQKGFVGASVLSGKGLSLLADLPSSVSALMAPLYLDGLLAVERVEKEMRAGKAPARGDLDVLVKHGRFDLAEDYVAASIATPSAALQLSEDGFVDIFECAKLLGCRDRVANLLRPYATTIVAKHPKLVGPLFEIFASALTEAELTAGLISCSQTLVGQRTERPIFKTADLVKKYCDSSSFVTLLHILDDSQHIKIFQNRQFMELCGDALLGKDVPDFVLLNSGLSLAEFIKLASSERKLSDAVHRGDRTSVERNLNDILLNKSISPERLVLLLRTYTYELASLELDASKLALDMFASAKDRLLLASILNDRHYLAKALDSKIASLNQFGAAVGAAIEPAVVVGASCLGDNSVLNGEFERWAARDGLTPLSISGGSIYEMFENQLVQREGAFVTADNDDGKVSVIITVYNPEIPLLILAIRSILQQTYRNLEIILIDDGSDLVPQSDIAALAALDPRIIFDRMPRNSGPYLSRNLALTLSSGRYVAIQDGDDFSHPQRLERQVRQFQNDAILQMCTGSHLRIDRNGRLQFEHTLGILGDGTMTSMFRRELFDSLGRFASVRSRGDVEFRERVKAARGAHVISHIDCPLILCYATPSSLSNMTARNFTHYLSLFRSMFNQPKHSDIVANSTRRLTVVAPWPLRP